VLEYLERRRRNLPAGCHHLPLAPTPPGVGWVYHTLLTGGNLSLAGIAHLQDWGAYAYGVSRCRGRSLIVASVGGFVSRPYSVTVESGSNCRVQGITLSDRSAKAVASSF